MPNANFVTIKEQNHNYLQEILVTIHITKKHTYLEENLWITDITGTFTKESCSLVAEHAGVEFGSFDYVDDDALAIVIDDKD